MPRICAVTNCKNTGGFSFPSDRNRRLLWIKALNQENLTLKSVEVLLVCEKHFTDSDYRSIGTNYYADTPIERRRLKRDAVPSIPSTTSDSLNLDGEGIIDIQPEPNTSQNEQKHLSSQPTIFPDACQKTQFHPEAADTRYNQSMNLDGAQKEMTSKEDTQKQNVNKRNAPGEVIDEGVKRIKVEEIEDANMFFFPSLFDHDYQAVVNIEKVNREVQVDFLDRLECTAKLFISHRFLTSTQCNAETQTCIPVPSTQIKVSRITRADKSKQKQAISSALTVANYITGFHGFSSITNAEELLELAGVSRETFRLLLLKMPSKDTKQIVKISPSNRLLLFLMKMKSGLAFSALSVLFNMQKETASMSFFSTLKHLSSACKSFVFWPEKSVIRQTMPSFFKPDHENCRVFVDSVEFEHCVKGQRIQNIIVCSPCGLICLVSKCHDGTQTADAQTTMSLSLTDLLEPGDVVVANKEFCEMKRLLVEGKQNISLVTLPSRDDKKHCGKEGVESTDNVDKIKLHVDRLMERIRTYKIVDAFSLEMLPHCDNVIFMCCVLLNLQALKIQPKD